MNKLLKEVTVLAEYLGDYIDEFLQEKEKRSKNTFKDYKCDINKLANDMFGYDDYKFIKKSDLESLTVDDLIQYFNACYQEEDVFGNRKYSNQTINRRMSSFKKLIEYLVIREKIDFPYHKLTVLLKSLPKTTIRIDVLSIKDADRCIEQFKYYSKGNIISLMAKLSVDTGLRANELITLTWRQCYPKEDTVIIKSVGDIKGKGNKDWLVEISKDIYNEMLHLKVDGENKIFNISYSYLAKVMNKVILDLELNDKNYTFHSFRKRGVSNVYNENNNIMTAKKFARHNSVSTTEIYLEESQDTITGYYSKGNSVDSELYKKVDHAELIKVLESMGGDLLHKINMKLNK